jgi:hypothetical protein
MPVGFPGRISRSDSLTVESAPVSASNPPTAFGSPVKLVGGAMQAIAANDAASLVWGFLVSAFPTQSTSNALGVSTPPALGVLDVMRRGFMVVALARGTAVKNGQVFMRTGTGGLGGTVGQIEAALDGAAVATEVPGSAGNGTLTMDVTTPLQAGAQSGAYSVKFTSATAYDVFDPKGTYIGSGANGTAFTTQLKFNIAAGLTAFAAGDSFEITVKANTAAIPNCAFTGAADASGNVEIEYAIAP